MTRRLANIGLTFLLSAGTVTFHGTARAWDSISEPRVRTMPRPRIQEPFFAPSFFDDRRFRMGFMKDTIGGTGARADDALTKLYRCPPQAIESGNLKDCQLVKDIVLTRKVQSKTDPKPVGAAWIEPRRTGEAEHDSEHTLITRRAAEVAGLIPATRLFETFWVRYPGANAVVASDLRFDEAGQPTPDYIAGQSVRPVALIPDEFSYVARSISLLELSQAPDFSHSLSDWAQGNETCPIEGMDGAYRLHPVEACHNFKAAMGAVNATHFAPLNREMWRYYHELARFKMLECNALENVKSYFYDTWQSTTLGPKFVSDAHTEAHECERLAMAYEMFAQHFLQDAWSVGHMWLRWGYPRWTDFESDVRLVSSEPPPVFPERNRAPRKALLAGAVGAFSGMIHGAKSVVVDLARESLGRTVGDYLTSLGAFDDPLNGGTYRTGPPPADPVDIEWVDAVGRFPGAGDLFWDPSVVTGAVVSQQEKYETQRTLLLSCAASSMREVYSAGPSMHGLATNPEIELVDPDSEECWERWATNRSMYHSLGPVDLNFARVLPGAYGNALNLVNDMVVKSLGTNPTESVIDFPVEEVENIPENQAEKRELAEDRDEFIRRLLARVEIDTWNIRENYTKNRDAEPLGTHSARQLPIGLTERIRFLGIPPVEPLDSPPFLPRDVDYVDQLPDISGAEADLALSRIFWRGDLRATCESALADGAAVLHALRNECLADAAVGGDPESCTGCVALTELLVPRCVFTPSFQGIGESKCSMAGVSSRAGLPAWWFDFLNRSLGVSVDPPFDSPWYTQYHRCKRGWSFALDWCTGSAQAPLDDEMTHRSNVNEYVENSTVVCQENTPQSYVLSFGTWRTRYAGILFEGYRVGGPWVIPMVTGFDSHTTAIPGPDDCSGDDAPAQRPELLARWQASLGALPLDELNERYYAGAFQPRCGVTQRVFDWNRSCAEASTVMGFSVPELNTFDPETGALMFESITPEGRRTCAAAEPRRYVGAKTSQDQGSGCPAGLECTVGGECVALRATGPQVLKLVPSSPFTSPPPPSPPP